MLVLLLSTDGWHKGWRSRRQAEKELNINILILLISKQGKGKRYEANQSGQSTHFITCKQSIKEKKNKKRRLVEPSNDAISPFPACSSIPGEKRKFKDHLEVKKLNQN